MSNERELTSNELAAVSGGFFPCAMMMQAACLGLIPAGEPTPGGLVGGAALEGGGCRPIYAND